MAKLFTLQVLLSITAINSWNVIQLDINKAFLNGTLNEEIYMDLPFGSPKQGENIVCKLNKLIYGFHQASCQWFSTFTTSVLDDGFT